MSLGNEQCDYCWGTGYFKGHGAPCPNAAPTKQDEKFKGFLDGALHEATSIARRKKFEGLATKAAQTATSNQPPCPRCGGRGWHSTPTSYGVKCAACNATGKMLPPSSTPAPVTPASTHKFAVGQIVRGTYNRATRYKVIRQSTNSLGAPFYTVEVVGGLPQVYSDQSEDKFEALPTGGVAKAPVTPIV